MPKFLYLLVLILLPIAPATAEPVETLMDLVNEYREQADLPPVRLDAQLSRIAERHNSDMAERGYFAHCSPDGDCLAERLQEQGYQARLWAENLAAGQATPQDVLQAWHESPAHRKNLRLREATRAGLSIDHHRSEKIASPLWTLILTRPR
ncbi:CAP domain-containing protein [Fodinicurvata halophila]|uniref:CAP domain-containing protein n=1 Tax=Fodinicurvata halophila TaxID=1419723 RepID=A0ABV8UIV9_9PROT